MLHYDAASGNWMLKGKIPSSSPRPQQQQQQRQEAPSPAAAISTHQSLSAEAVSGEKETTKQSSSPSPLHTNVDRPHDSAIEHLSPENQQQQQKFGGSSSLAATTTSDRAAQLNHHQHQHSISRGDSAESTVTISPPPTTATVQRYENTESAAAPASREETAKVEAGEVRDRNFTSPHVMRTTAAANRQDVNENRTNHHSSHAGHVLEEKEEIEEEEHLHEVDASLSDSSVTSSLLARFLHRLEKTIAVEGTDPSIQSDAATASAAYHKVLAEKLCEASQRVVQRHLFVPSRAQPTLRSPSPSSSRAASSSSTAHHHHRSISPSHATADHSGSATVPSSVPHFGAQRCPTVLTVVENLSFTPSHGGCNVRRQRPHKKTPSSMVVGEDNDDEGERGFFSQTHLWMGCRDGAVLVFSVESVASSSSPSSDASPLSEEAGRMKEGCALVDTFPFAASPHAVVGPSSRHPTGLGVTSMIYTAANFSKHGGGCFASHPQGVPRFVIVGYGNGTIKWFDARGRRKPPAAGSPDASTCIQTLAQAHNGAVTALLVTLCGRFLLSGSDDGVVVLWDVAVESHATSSRKGGAAAAVAGSSLKPPEHHIVRFLLHATVGGSPNDDVQGGDYDPHHGGQHTAAVVVASGGVLCMSQVGSRVFCGGSRRGVLHELDLAKRGIVRLFRDADVPSSPVCQIESIVAPFAMTPHTADTVPNITTSLFVAPQRPNFLWALHENGIMVVWWLRPVRNTTGWATTPTVVHRFDLARRSPLLHSGGGGGGVMSRGGVAMDSSHQPMPTTTATAAATTTALQQRKGMPTMYVQCEGDRQEEPTLWVCIEDRLVVVDVSRRMGKVLASFDTMSWRSGAEDEQRTPVPGSDAGTAPRRLLVGANGFRSLWICCGLVVPQKAFPPQATSDVVLLEIHPDLAQREAVSLAAALEWSVVGSRRAPSDWQDLQDRLQRAQESVSSLETQRNELKAVNAEQRTQLEALAEARLESEQRSHTLTLAVKESIAAFHEQASQRRALQEDLRVVTQERDLLKEETIMLRKAMATLVEQMRTTASSSSAAAAPTAAVVGAVFPRQAAAVVQSVADDVGVAAEEESHNEEKRAYDDDFDTASPPSSLSTQPRQSNLPLENADVTTAWDDQEN